VTNLIVWPESDAHRKQVPLSTRSVRFEVDSSSNTMQTARRVVLKQQRSQIPSWRCVAPTTVPRCRSRGVAVRAIHDPLLPLVVPQSPNKATMRILPLLSELVEIQVRVCISLRTGILSLLGQSGSNLIFGSNCRP
jgi:hypothetical protein